MILHNPYTIPESEHFRQRLHQNLYVLSYNKIMAFVNSSAAMVNSYNTDDSSLLGCDTVLLHKQILLFQGITVPSSSGPSPRRGDSSTLKM